MIPLALALLVSTQWPAAEVRGHSNSSSEVAHIALGMPPDTTAVVTVDGDDIGPFRTSPAGVVVFQFRGGQHFEISTP